MRVFVTVGNALYPFDRMLQMVDDALAGIPDVEGVCQHGPNKVRPRRLTPVAKLPWNEFDVELKRADVVVCQAGVGTLWSTLDAGHRPLVVPRRAPLGEIVNDHQVEIVNELAARGLIIPIHDAPELRVWLDRCHRGEIRRSDAVRPAAPPLEGIAKAMGSAHARPSRVGTFAMWALSLLSPPLDRLRIR